MWPDSVIHLFVGGSGAHGAKGDTHGDLDLNGVYIQPLEYLAGISRADAGGKAFDPDVHVWKSSGDERRNTQDDTDLCLYSLRKWAGMAASGNTTALEFLFVPNLVQAPNLWGKHVVPNTGAFLSAHAAHHFREFCNAQMERLRGRAAGRHGKRPALVGEHGFDTKLAMHALRVLGEGVELMRHGRITLPRPEPERAYLTAVRRGQVPKDDVLAACDARLAELEEARLATSLPPEPDRARISQVIAAAMAEHWQWRHEPARVLAKALSVATFWISESVRLHPVDGMQRWEDRAACQEDILRLALELHGKDK